MKGGLILASTLTNIDNELYSYSNEFLNHFFYINYVTCEQPKHLAEYIAKRLTE